MDEVKQVKKNYYYSKSYHIVEIIKITQKQRSIKFQKLYMPIIEIQKDTEAHLNINKLHAATDGKAEECHCQSQYRNQTQDLQRQTQIWTSGQNKHSK